MKHDARAYAGQLRDHLAAHDRRVSFLFGAGTSSAVSSAVAVGKSRAPLVPAIAGMTAECQKAVEALGPKEAAAWAKLSAECRILGIPVNIESILGRIRIKLDAVTGLDQLNGLVREEWNAIDVTVRNAIARLANPPEAAIPKHLPHDDFARWIRNTSRRQPVEVFTTNYDVLFERSFDRLRVPHFDGFIGSQNAYFSAESIEDDALLPPATWVRYWKLHGSVSWSLEIVGGDQRITRGAPRNAGEMILPSNRKYDESRKEPYRSLLDRLSTVLAREDSLLISCGFSFNDQHINAIILDALEQHPRTHLIATSYSNIDENHHITKWALDRHNLIHIAPNAAVIACRFGGWGGKPDPRLTEATGGLVRPDPDDPGAVRVLAGDFAALASFLRSIQGTVP
jgi:hypothetical protein